jgi:hypothetical protein
VLVITVGRRFKKYSGGLVSIGYDIHTNFHEDPTIGSKVNGTVGASLLYFIIK